MSDDKSERKTNIDRGWAWVVMITSYLGMVILCTALYMNGVIYVELLNKYGEGEAKTSLVGALCSGLLCCLAPLVGALNNKISCRFSMIIGGAVTTIGFAICAFVDSLNMIIIFNGIFVGIGFAHSMSGLICVVGFYFEKYRDIVLSVVFLTVGISMFISAPFGLYLLDVHGLTATYLIQASIQAHMCIFGVLSRPSVIERQVQKQKQMERKQNLKMRSTSYIDITLLKNRSYLCILFSISTWNFCLSAGFIHLPNYVSVQDGSNSDISLIMLLFSLSNLAGRFLGSLTVSKLHRNIAKVYATELAISGIITALFPLYSKIWGGLYIFTIQLGIFTGWPNTMMMPISLDYVGISKLSEAYGYYFLFCGIGFFTGPVCIGFIYGVSDSYENSFIVAGVILFLGGVSAAGSFLCKSRESTNSEYVSNELTIIDIKNIHSCNNIDAKLGASLGSIHSGSVTDLLSCSRSQNLYIKDTSSIIENVTDIKEVNGLLNDQR
ncbi:monocarboxylate transporter 12-like [Ruditapes philippinarum]|uniref:monocarboxylate transporter 12-like n=1 Tax=Ruditapes philippinarum TaxID=129788 RepID=UPI00295AA69E|nr:monocarboxylate transporter 12-like [Ruditapes philippinarum]XP_060593792.1 monocarboxylate transporter 12-like [Ruditapes philippinarum]XP_060593793.1 monocarboxylate transporter 12-like [Ruditapes philippinarum]